MLREDRDLSVRSRNRGRLWSISSAGTVPLDQATTRAGTPATVAPGGTSCRTTLPAPTLASRPISTLPSTLAPAHSNTPSRTLGCRSPRSLPVPPKVTSCRIDTSSPMTAVSPTTRPVPWSIKTAASDRHGGMDIDGKDLGNPALQETGEIAPVIAPQPMADAMPLQRVKALVVEERRQMGLGRRVAGADGDEVGDGRGDDRRILGHRGAREFAEPVRRQRRLGELAREQRAERRVEAVMTQHRQIEKAAQHRLARRRAPGFGAQRRPQLGFRPPVCLGPRCGDSGAAKLISFMACLLLPGERSTADRPSDSLAFDVPDSCPARVVCGSSRTGRRRGSTWR